MLGNIEHPTNGKRVSYPVFIPFLSCTGTVVFDCARLSQGTGLGW